MTSSNSPAGLRRFVSGATAPQTGTAPQSGTAPRNGTASPGGTGLPDSTPAAVLDRIRAVKGENARPDETCEMCATPIAAEHNHIADLDKSSLLCTCRACFLLFENSQAGGGHYRAVPERYLADPGRPLTAAEWDELEIPVGLAFFLYSSQRDEVAGFYPSPAGSTECRLDLGAWQRIAADHPMLGAIAPDVEAALISRTGDTIEHFVVPIDACYELAGRMRMLWKGFDGGTEARQSIAEFLGNVRSRARVFTQEPS